MRRARWLSVLVGAGLLGSCGDGLEPPTTGSIALIIRVDASVTASALAVHHVNDDTVPGSASGKTVAASLAGTMYTAARVRVDGPTPKTSNLTLVGTNWEGSVDGLSPGPYTVTVEALEGTDIAAMGSTANVSVTAGQQTEASVTVQTFRPDLTVAINSPTTSLVIPVTVGGVTGATSYRLEWAANASFSGASSKPLTAAGNATVGVTDVGTYYVRARALTAAATGAPSAAASVQVIGDVPPTGGDQASAALLGFGPAVNERLDSLNIAPASDQDWFAIEGCRLDTLIVETFAKRLTPASELNSRLRLFPQGVSTPVAENDDIDAATQTDSRFQYVFPSNGSYQLQVSSSQGTTAGAYELNIEVKASLNEDVGSCKPIIVSISPTTATLAAQEQQQFTASAVDAAGVAVTGLKYFWVSSNTNVAIVDTLGMVTAVGGGTAAITVAGQGEPASAAVTVTGPALGAPTQLVFSTQPTDAAAGSDFSPAVEVEIRDANNNLVANARNTVTLAIANNPGGATLTGTKTVNANSGVARFTGLYMDKAAAAYTIQATSSGLTSATSTPFTISPGPPTRLAFGTQPSNVAGNAAFPSPVTVAIADKFGNPVTSATNDVALSLAGNPWKSPFAVGGTLAGTTTRSAGAGTGIATFDDLTMDRPGTGYSLLAQATGLDSAVSGDFNVTLTMQAVSASDGGYHTCGVTASGTYCWGRNNQGQLGGSTGSTSSDSVAVLVVGGMTFTRVTAGAAHSCGITAADAAYCWGDNSAGQLGNGNTPTDSPVPVPVSGGLAFASITAGAQHTCGLTTGGALYCWGRDSEGQLGDDATFAPKSTPAQVAGTWSAVNAGSLHTCGVSGGNAYCWGSDAYGQLGDNATLANQPTPAAVGGGLTWTSVSAGDRHSCGRTDANLGYCWGDNGQGQIGLSPPTSVAETEANNTAGTADAITLGQRATGEVNPAGEADYWAFAAAAGTELNIDVDASQFGSPLDPTLTLYSTDGITQLAFNDDWDGLDSRIQYTVGGAGTYYIAIRAFAGGGGAGQTYTINFNSSATLPRTPRQVFGGLTFSAISAGGGHSCGIASGVAYCWGDNAYGQLGDGQMPTDSPTRVAVSGGLSFTAISAGFFHTCGMVGTATYCWGRDDFGQVGDGARINRPTPAQIVQ